MSAKKRLSSLFGDRIGAAGALGRLSLSGRGWDDRSTLARRALTWRASAAAGFKQGSRAPAEVATRMLTLWPPPLRVFALPRYSGGLATHTHPG